MKFHKVLLGLALVAATACAQAAVYSVTFKAEGYSTQPSWPAIASPVSGSFIIDSGSNTDWWNSSLTSVSLSIDGYQYSMKDIGIGGSPDGLGISGVAFDRVPRIGLDRFQLFLSVTSDVPTSLLYTTSSENFLHFATGVSYSVSPVPEANAFALAAAGLMVTYLARRRKK